MVRFSKYGSQNKFKVFLKNWLKNNKLKITTKNTKKLKHKLTIFAIFNKDWKKIVCWNFNWINFHKIKNQNKWEENSLVKE